MPNWRRFLGGALSFSNAMSEAFEYSNVGFVLFGKVVSKVTGMRLRDFVTREIPLRWG